MKSKALLVCLYILSAMLFTLWGTAFAVSPSAISIDVAPANPSPNQDVTITLSSFAANLNSVNIEWIVDGKNVLSGIGKKSLSLTAKAANQDTRVDVRILLPDGEINKTVTIRPGVLLLLWQANDSYVPPFYKGKALPTPGSEIKVVAMPEFIQNNKRVNPQNMTYDWKQNYNNIQDASGYGKNFFIFINDYLEDLDNVSVVANTLDQKYTSESAISISTVNPEIYFYKKDIELGTAWENTVRDNYVVKGEEVISAEPYFISPKEFNRPELKFYWAIGGRSVSVPEYLKNLMPVKAEAGTSGTTKIKLEIENTDKIYQTAKKEINIKF